MKINRRYYSQKYKEENFHKESYRWKLLKPDVQTEFPPQLFTKGNYPESTINHTKFA